MIKASSTCSTVQPAFGSIEKSTLLYINSYSHLSDAVLLDEHDCLVE